MTQENMGRKIPWGTPPVPLYPTDRGIIIYIDKIFHELSFQNETEDSVEVVIKERHRQATERNEVPAGG